MFKVGSEWLAAPHWSEDGSGDDADRHLASDL